MSSIKYLVILFLFSNVLLKALADNIFKEKNFFQRRNSYLVNFFARKFGYDVKGWIDITNNRFDFIDIKLVNNKLICNTGNGIIEVNKPTQTLISTTQTGIYSEVLFNHSKLSKAASFLNPIPVMEIKENISEINHNHLENFEGYVVCEKPGTDAILIPKIIEEVEFIKGPWNVKVSISLLRNPIAPFGRQFLVNILDNISVFKEKRNLFTLPFPVKSFSDVYDYHVAVEDTKKGIFCTLERNSKDELSLNCGSWKKSYFLALNGTLLVGLISMYSIQGMVFPHLKHDEDNNIKIKGKMLNISKYSSLIYLGLTTVSNIVFGVLKFIDIKKKLDKFDKDLNEATLFSLWKLQYPESYFPKSKKELGDIDDTKVGNIEKVDNDRKTKDNSKKNIFNKYNKEYSNFIPSIMLLKE